MKKILCALLVLGCVVTLSVNAEEKKADKKPELSAEAKAARKELLEKYDTNKDGKLDKEERAKITGEDKDKLAKAGFGGGEKKKKKE